MNKIITCIDGSALSHGVCQAGVWASNKLSKTLLLLHAIEKSNTPSAEDLSGAIGLGARTTLLQEMVSLDEQRGKVALELGREILDHAAQMASAQAREHIEKIQRHGGIVDAICDLEADARIIVMGRKGAGSGENVKALGSHIEQIIRRVHTPVLIVSRDFVEPKNFMLAYDGRETADKAVKRIIEGGLLYNMTCHLVTVNNNQAGLFDKFKSTEAMLVAHGFDVQSSFLEGNVFNVLMDYKKDQHVDLLVMGAFSRSKLATVFLGSNTLKMIENTLRPLLVLR
ncbi:universal stress protein A [Iodidimonas nitroreducens]|uniref:Universal stress protein A n=1 Tax=Iodidimonas nitroreducens TaxID=1236968 RepID=A0A5A7N5W4_9PROT|nr:universal stress protein [Iodidimonas nitroreducens]GAK33017.1 universal stress protein [alpha proteobacterium Q-1]GER03478.1 universal stress protein A [Iodidimonas nitroreducens]